MDEKLMREETKFEGVKVFKHLNENSIIAALEEMKKERKVVTGFFPIDLREEFYLFYKKREITEPSEEDLIKSREPKIVEKETLPTPQNSNIRQFIKDYFFLLLIVGGLIFGYLMYNNII